MEHTIIEEIRAEILAIIEKRNKLINKKRMLENASSRPNMNINHIKAIKEEISLPENQELIEDKPSTICGYQLEIPKTCIPIFENTATKITNPLDVFYYYGSIKISVGGKTNLDRYFEPKTSTTFNFDDQNIIGKIFVNFEKPRETYFVEGKNCKSFEAHHDILLLKKEYIGNVHISEIRNIYMMELITNGYEGALEILYEFFDYIKTNDDFQRQQKK